MRFPSSASLIMISVLCWRVVYIYFSFLSPHALSHMPTAACIFSRQSLVSRPGIYGYNMPEAMKEHLGENGREEGYQWVTCPAEQILRLQAWQDTAEKSTVSSLPPSSLTCVFVSSLYIYVIGSSSPSPFPLVRGVQ